MVVLPDFERIELAIEVARQLIRQVEQDQKHIEKILGVIDFPDEALQSDAVSVYRLTHKCRELLNVAESGEAPNGYASC